LPFAEGLDDLLLKRLLRHFAIAIVIFTPPERAGHFDVLNGYPAF
jgi:hypothetical protein